MLQRMAELFEVEVTALLGPAEPEPAPRDGEALARQLAGINEQLPAKTGGPGDLEDPGHRPAGDPGSPAFNGPAAYRCFRGPGHRRVTGALFLRGLHAGRSFGKLEEKANSLLTEAICRCILSTNT